MEVGARLSRKSSCATISAWRQTVIEDPGIDVELRWCNAARKSSLLASTHFERSRVTERVPKSS